MRDYGRTTNKIKNSRDEAKKNELFFDHDIGDLIIKKDIKDYDVSIYDEFVNRSIDMEIIGNKPVIYGIAIDMNESDPEKSVTYVGSCESFLPISSNNEDNREWNENWSEKLLSLVFGFRPVLFKDENIVSNLDPDDFSIDTSGNVVTDDMGDIMIMMRRTYYKFVVSDGKLYFYVSNYRPDGSYTTVFSGPRMYISYHDCCEYEGVLASLHDKEPKQDTLENLKKLLPLNYDLLDKNIYFYLVGLTWLLNKRLDSPYLYRFGNIINNYLGIYGLLCDKYGNLCDQNKKIIRTEIFQHDYITQVMDYENILYPIEYGGSSNTYFCSLIHISNDPEDYNEIKVHNNLLEFYVDNTLQQDCVCRMIYNKGEE